MEAQTRYTKVRVKGTDLVGTKAFREAQQTKYYGTVVGRNTAVAFVYFQETGEVRLFNEEFLEDVEETE